MCVCARACVCVSLCLYVCECVYVSVCLGEVYEGFSVSYLKAHTLMNP